MSVMTTSAGVRRAPFHSSRGTVRVSAQRHWNAPVFNRCAGISGMVRLATDRIAIIAMSQFFDDMRNALVGLEARRCGS